MKKVTITTRQKSTKKGQSVYFDIYSNGVRKYEFLGITLTGNKKQDKITLETIEEIRVKRLAELQRNIHGLVIESKIKLIDLIIEIKNSKTKQSTKSNYENLRVKFESFDNSILSKKLTAVNESILEKFKDYLLTQNSINSTNMYLHNLKSCFNFAVKKNYIQINPMKNFDIPARIETEKSFLTVTELKILESYKNRCETLRAFLFACYTGLRYSDVKKLKYEDINDGTIKVKMKKTERHIYIPLSNQAARLIDTTILNHNGLIFNLPTLANINIRLKKIFREAKINKSKVSFHLSRHSFATIGLTIGIELETISKILGHSNLKTTQIYAKIVNEKIKTAIDKFNSI